ncbi:MAG: acyl-CoA dehydrogenase family protein [Rhodospirillales bacterium]
MFIDPEVALKSDKIQALSQKSTTDFRARAPEYDRTCSMPTKNIEDLFKAGFLTCAVTKETGGMGSNLDTEDPATYLQAIRVTARGCSSTAHCLQVNNHTAWIMDAMGTDYQKEKFVKPGFARPFLASFVGSEPTRKHMYIMSTTAKPDGKGGYIVNGVKNYATNGPTMDYAIIFASVEGVNDYQNNHLMTIIETKQPGVRVDNDWYRPLGMRAAASPIVHLDNVHVPKEHVLGEPGSYPRMRWQGKYHLGFTANYLGTAEGMFEWYRDYATKKGKAKDPIIMMRTGEMKIALNAAQSLFHDAIRAWKTKSVVEAELLSMSAKYTAAHTAMNLSRSITEAAGSTALFEEFPLGRMIRDLQTHILHAGHDKTAQIMGQSQLGEEFDSTLQR